MLLTAFSTLIEDSFGLPPGGIGPNSILPTSIISSAGIAAAPLVSLPQLHSNVSATAKLFLDFDGHFEATWGSRTNVNTPAFSQDGDATTFSAGELSAIDEIWTRVAEDYASFNIDVTTVDPGNVANRTTSVIAIGGSYSDWYGNAAGGVSYIGGFYNLSSNVAYVFSNNLSGNAKYIAEAAAHEAGHQFGLQHQSTWSGSTLVAAYNSGNSAWAPVMGIGYSAARTTWYNGPTIADPTAYQDDLAILSGPFNGFGYKPDDFGSSIATASPFPLTGGNANFSGLIGQNGDSDVWSFTTTGGTFNFQLAVSNFGPNLDAVLELNGAEGQIIATATPTDSLGATLSVNVPAGTYYLIARSNGDYGNLGRYTITGNLPTNAVSTVIDAGGGMTGSYAGDQFFSGGSAYGTGNAINTSGVSNPAPQAVYQTVRYGNFTYTLPGLTAGVSYTMRLHFSEVYWTSAGKRVFNVQINGNQVLTNFDILATAGAPNKAVVMQLTVTADASGKITIAFVSVVGDAMLNGLEILTAATNTPPTVAAAASASSNPVNGLTTDLRVLGNDADTGEPSLNYIWSVISAPSGATNPTFSVNGSNAAKNTTVTYFEAGNYTFRATVTDPANVAVTSDVSMTVTAASPQVLALDAGGGASGSYRKDQFFSGGYAYATGNAINTSGVSNPAPQAVYQTVRYGNFTYALPGLTPGVSYTLRLHFAEVYWTSAGKRVFNVQINGNQVLTNFDILATAGAPNKAVVMPLTVTADASGKITIAFVSVVGDAMVNGLEVLPAPSTQLMAVDVAGSAVGSYAVSFRQACNF